MQSSQPEEPEGPHAGDPADGSSEFLRQLFTWLAGLILVTYRRLRPILAWIRRALWNRAVKRALGLALLLAVILTAIRAVPVLYGRYALIHAAGNAARQIHLKGEERIRADLARAAAGLGLTEAAARTEVFRVETTQEDGATWCTIRFEFVHEVDCYGFGTLPVAIRGEVLRAVLEPSPTVNAGNPEPD